MTYTITIDTLKQVQIDDNQWAQHAEGVITDGQSSYAFSAGGIPAELSSANALAYLQERDAALWQAASARGAGDDPLERVDRFGWRFMVALALVVFDEVNALRTVIRLMHPAQATQPALQDRTLAQLKSALLTRLRSL